MLNFFNSKLLDNIFTFVNRLQLRDESTNSMRLEFILIYIQYLNKVNDIDECEKLYFEADKINQEKIIKDNRINAIIAEEAGKYYFRREVYSLALEKFKDAYRSYQDSANTKSNIILKYIIYCFLLQKSEEAIIDTEEVKRFPNDKMLQYLVEFKDSCQKLDMKKFNFILHQKIIPEESDFLIKDNFPEIVRNLRVNYLIKKLKLYKKISIETLQKDMDLDRNNIYSLVNIAHNSGLINVTITFFILKNIKLNKNKRFFIKILKR